MWQLLGCISCWCSWRCFCSCRVSKLGSKHFCYIRINSLPTRKMQGRRSCYTIV
ncbi:364L [Invertebrate iridescent virus Kaz2018]|nr:364L [Invertebrate iridescent virus Kaz2018]